MFPRTSSFAQVQAPVSLSPKQADTPPEPAKYRGPEREELERWYDILVDLIERASHGDVDHTVELTDLRDQIYAYLA